MVSHHNSLKLCSDRDLPIWLLRKRHELRETRGKMLVIGSYSRRRVLLEIQKIMREVTI